MTTVTTPAAALLKLKSRKTRDLIGDLVLTGITIDKLRKDVDPEIFTVRGWIMDELERRDQEAYEAWIDSDKDDDGLYDYFDC